MMHFESRSMLLKDIERALQDQKLVNQVVYDSDIERNVAMEARGDCSAAELSCDSERFVLTFSFLTRS